MTSLLSSSSTTSSFPFPECPICFEKFSTSNSEKKPRLLPCAHSFCHSCIERMKTEDDHFFKCPTCRMKVYYKHIDLNYNIELVKLMEEIEKYLTPPPSTSTSSTTPPIILPPLLPPLSFPIMDLPPLCPSSPTSPISSSPPPPVTLSDICLKRGCGKPTVWFCLETHYFLCNLHMELLIEVWPVIKHCHISEKEKLSTYEYTFSSNKYEDQVRKIQARIFEGLLEEQMKKYQKYINLM